MTKASSTGRRSSLPVLWATLALTVLILLAWGHFKLLDQDEVFVLQTDSVASVRQLIAVQRHTPIALDPLFYHLLGHASVRLLGATAFAVRLPSLLGFLLMQVCLFATARRIAGEAAGVVAAAVPALTATLYYGVEARPYGVLLGLGALMLWSWGRAARAQESSRVGALVTLALATALALNTHYFAILLLIPLCVAELYRTSKARRIDWPMVLAIAAGMAGVVFALPFQRAAGEFRKNYYNAGQVNLHAVTQSYRALVVQYTDYTMRVQHAAMVVLVLAAAALLLTLVRRMRSSKVTLITGEGMFLCVLAALPFFGFLLARFVTHSMEVRYVLSAMLGLAVLIAVALQPMVQRAPAAWMAALLLLLTLTGAERVREAHVQRLEAATALSISPQVRAYLTEHPAVTLYVQNVGHFEEALPYLSDPLLRGRVALLYSQQQELQWLHHDTGSLTAMHLRAFCDVPVASYEALQQRSGEALLVVYPASGWDWIGRQLAASGAAQTAAGAALGGQAVTIHLPPRSAS